MCLYFDVFGWVDFYTEKSDIDSHCHTVTSEHSDRRGLLCRHNHIKYAYNNKKRENRTYRKNALPVWSKRFLEWTSGTKKTACTVEAAWCFVRVFWMCRIVWVFSLLLRLSELMSFIPLVDNSYWASTRCGTTWAKICRRAERDWKWPHRGIALLDANRNRNQALFESNGSVQFSWWRDAAWMCCPEA